LPPRTPIRGQEPQGQAVPGAPGPRIAAARRPGWQRRVGPEPALSEAEGATGSVGRLRSPDRRCAPSGWQRWDNLPRRLSERQQAA